MSWFVHRVFQFGVPPEITSAGKMPLKDYDCWTILLQVCGGSTQAYSKVRELGKYHVLPVGL